MFGNHKTRRILFGCSVLAGLIGCGGGSPDAAGPAGDRRSEAERLFGGVGAGSAAQDAGSWSIGLMVFAGPDRAARAAEAADDLRARHRALADAFVDERGDRAVVLVGAHPSPSSKEAVAALERVRSIRIGGEQPFRNAFYVPPSGERPGDLDLRSARTRYGGSYSLQIGVYGRPDGSAPPEKELAQIRSAAEEAARKLRREGELAFYFHGPTLSMVTVGALRAEDLEPGSNALAVLQQRFPHNLLNGQGVRQRVRTESGERWDMQRSFPVGVPE